jgi:hypothetical protein
MVVDVYYDLKVFQFKLINVYILVENMCFLIIFKWFLPLKIQINSQKPGFGREKSVKDVVTLGPTTQATLVWIIFYYHSTLATSTLNMLFSQNLIYEFQHFIMRFNKIWAPCCCAQWRSAILYFPLCFNMVFNNSSLFMSNVKFNLN